MIPRVKKWQIRVLADRYGPEHIEIVEAPNKALAKIGFALDFPNFWSRAYKVSLYRPPAVERCNMCRAEIPTGWCSACFGKPSVANGF